MSRLGVSLLFMLVAVAVALVSLDDGRVHRRHMVEMRLQREAFAVRLERLQIEIETAVRMTAELRGRVDAMEWRLRPVAEAAAPAEDVGGPLPAFQRGRMFDK
jgi:hypothetical protein